MDWISQNWVWVLFAVAMVAMHLFGHGGYGGHGGHGWHGGHGRSDDHQKDTTLARKDNRPGASEPGSGHHH